MGERRETISLNIVCFDNRLILLENGKRNLPGIKEKIALRRNGTAGGGGRKLSQEEKEGREFLVDVLLFTPSERHSTIGFSTSEAFFPVSYRCSNRQKLKKLGKVSPRFPTNYHFFFSFLRCITFPLPLLPLLLGVRL